MLFDFHTHTFLSDGVLLPIELIRRGIANGCTAIALTDHVSASNYQSVVDALVADCRLAEKHWEIRAIVGVELTHLPPAVIPEMAALVRERGARLVVVHGETPAEPVAPGTNLAAVSCAQVDILAHPGAIDLELATLAAQNGVFLELSAHVGHCLGNGSVASMARQADALLLVNSDAHEPDEVLTEDFAQRVAAGAGLSEAEQRQALLRNPEQLLARVDARGR
jgi:histidinol phosphatase-like PHP family hydrolase